MAALASLADREYQEAVWLRCELPHENYEDSLGMALHALFDDWMVLPSPSQAVGPILVDGPEVGRLEALGEVLGGIVDELTDSSDETYLADGRWPEVVKLASGALAAMVRAGPFDMPQVAR